MPTPVSFSYEGYFQNDALYSLPPPPTILNDDKREWKVAKVLVD